MFDVDGWMWYRDAHAERRISKLLEGSAFGNNNLKRTLMDDIKLEIRTTDSKIMLLCREYWATNEVGNFTIKVGELAAKYGLRTSDVFATVNQNSCAFLLSISCKVCGSAYRLNSRSDLTIHRGYVTRNILQNWKCQTCIQKEAIEAERQRLHNDQIKQKIVQEYLSHEQTNSTDFTISSS